MMTAAKLRSRIATTLAGNPDNPPITLTLREARELVNALLLKRAETPEPSPDTAWLARTLQSLEGKLATDQTPHGRFLSLRAFLESLLRQAARPEQYEHLRQFLTVRPFVQAFLALDAQAQQPVPTTDPHQILAQIRDLAAQAPAPVLSGEPPAVSERADMLHLHPAVGELSVRSRNGLLRTGLSSIRQIAAMSDEQLLKQPGLGQKSVEEIRAWIERHAHG